MTPAATTDRTELASHLRLSVTRLARKLRQEAEPGITPSLLVTLSTIERAGAITLGDLSSVEQVQPPTMSRFVAALVDAGLVTREADPEDRRVAWVRPTAEGVKLLRHSRKRKDAYLVKQLRRLDPADLATLERATEILDRLVEGGR